MIIQVLRACGPYRSLHRCCVVLIPLPSWSRATVTARQECHEQDETGAANRRVNATATRAELFNLQTDIGEQTNLAPSQPEKTKEFGCSVAEVEL